MDDAEGNTDPEGLVSVSNDGTMGHIDTEGMDNGEGTNDESGAASSLFTIGHNDTLGGGRARGVGSFRIS